MVGADTAWVLTSAALVILMTPGLGLFYGGLVRAKNALNTLFHSLFLLGAISVQWALFGYSLAFSPDLGGGLVGGLQWIGLRGSDLSRTQTTAQPSRTSRSWSSRWRSRSSPPP